MYLFTLLRGNIYCEGGAESSIFPMQKKKFLLTYLFFYLLTVYSGCLLRQLKMECQLSLFILYKTHWSFQQKVL